ncbi:MAG: hypothetical protein LBT00_11520 [Spirochaetaceae bacterium]|nr:hypothetical protein [Spirochaetaceae bacterium]
MMPSGVPYSPQRPASDFRAGAWHTVGVRHTYGVLQSRVRPWTLSKPPLALIGFA